MYARTLFVALFTVIISVFLIGCQANDITLQDETVEVTPIDQLERTDHFIDGALEHILEGEINRQGEAVGFHYNMLETKKGEIIENTKTPVDSNGVYEAQVEIDGVKKRGNNGYSTFFPDEWDTQEVIDAINDAYEHRQFIHGNTYEGITEDGVILRMYVTNDEQIISAFPLYNR